MVTPAGACGYKNLYVQGCGTQTAALSTVLFNRGYSCGGSYEIRCVATKWCWPLQPSTVITATNLCPPNWVKDSNNGGWCNPPRCHFDMAKPAFRKIVNSKCWHCSHTIPQGNRSWHIVFITNVAGPGDLILVYIKGSRARWILMSHNWGVGYQVFQGLLGQKPLLHACLRLHS
ncbi:unnamed protein product [Sphagnum jensenii]|uniref:Expansin n=1 Tax=Sphagnum jensenii TaxID=128206 RepID=A0ABP0WSM8_9BRYO